MGIKEPIQKGSYGKNISKERGRKILKRIFNPFQEFKILGFHPININHNCWRGLEI